MLIKLSVYYSFGSITRTSLFILLTKGNVDFFDDKVNSFQKLTIEKIDKNFDLYLLNSFHCFCTHLWVFYKA